MRRHTTSVDIDRRIQICRYEIVNLDQDIKAKIAAIASSFDGDASALNTLCQDVRRRLDECEEKAAELERLAKALAKSQDASLLRLDVDSAVKRCRTEAARNLTALRQASQQALSRVHYEQRSALLAQSADATSEVKLRGAKLSQQSAEFSDQLTHLLRHMDVQVRQSEEALRSLTTSSQALGETEMEFRGMGATVTSAGKLLSKYGRREITDRILFVFALAFFFGTALYIVKKRLFAV